MLLPQKSSKLYHNIKAYDKSGRFIFTCSLKKAQWYIDKELCDIVSDEPLEIQLNFDTNGTGNYGDDFYLQDREDVCVVCGRKDNLTLHHVVPLSFRRFLPDSIIQHSHHDVLPLCIEHHDQYNSVESKLRKQLAAEYNAPVNGIRYGGRSSGCIYASAIIGSGDNIPSAKIGWLFKQLDDILGRPATMNDVEHIANSYRFIHWTQGEIVSWQLLTMDDVWGFIKRWRQHFIDAMRPQFLPPGWDIDRTTR